MADKITDIIDQSAFKQVQDLTKNLKDLNDLMVKTIENSIKLNANVGNASGIVNVSNAINNQATALKKVSEVQTQFIQTDIQLKNAEENLANSLNTSTNALSKREQAELEAQISARESQKLSKSTIESNAQVSKSVDDLRKQKLGEKLATQDMLKAEKELVSVQIANANSVARARKENILLKGERDSINLSTTGSIKRIAELNKKIDENTAFIKFNGDEAQKQTMNVGNYESALRNLGKSATKAFSILRTLAYIIPGLGISGIVGLAVEGLIMLADSMGILSKKTEEQIKQSKMFAEVQNEMISSIAKELTSLDVLYQTATNVNLSYKQRGEAVDELQNQYPEMFSNANREKLLNGELADSYDILTSSIFKRAEETAKMNLLNKAILERTALQLEYENLTSDNAKGEFYYNQKSAELIKNQIAGKDRQIQQIEKSIQKSKEGFGNDLFFIDEKTKKEYDAQNKLDKIRAIKGKDEKNTKSSNTPSAPKVNKNSQLKKEYETEQKLAQDNADKIYNSNYKLMKEINEVTVESAKYTMENEKFNLEEKLKANSDYFSAKTDLLDLEEGKEIKSAEGNFISIQTIELKYKNLRLQQIDDFNKRKNGIIQSDADKETKIELAKLNKLKDQYDDYTLETLRQLDDAYSKGLISTEEYQKKRNYYAIIGNQNSLNAQLTYAENILKSEKITGEKRVELEKQVNALKNAIAKGNADTTATIYETEDEKIKRQVAQFEAYQKGVYDVLSAINSILVDSANAEADKKIENIDRVEKAELDSLDRLSLSAKEKEEQRLKIEIDAENRRKQINNDRITRLRKLAAIQKAVDIMNIVTGTAVAIISALGAKPWQPLNIAIASGIALTGSAQLAKAIATPLPQYAKGIESTPNDSFAIVGEKGTELVTEKSGKQYLTPNSDTLTYLPKGTKVTPHHELMANVYDNAHKYMASNNNVTTDTMQTALIQSFEELYNKVDNLSEIMAKKNMNVSIFGDYEHAMRIKKSRM
jgi:hypothetical protein